jgi:hypothetical protein
LLKSLLSIAGSADGLLHNFALMHLYWNAMESDYLQGKIIASYEFRLIDSVIPGRAEGANPESRRKF